MLWFGWESLCERTETSDVLTSGMSNCGRIVGRPERESGGQGVGYTQWKEENRSPEREKYGEESAWVYRQSILSQVSDFCLCSSVCVSLWVFSVFGVCFSSFSKEISLSMCVRLCVEVFSNSLDRKQIRRNIKRIPKQENDVAVRVSL